MLKVAANNSDWTAAGISVGPRDLVTGAATGSVSYSKLSSSVEADATGSGGLEMRVGTTVSPAGKTWMSGFNNASGEVKLRVRDNNHTDNRGTYDVILIVIPEDVLKSSECQKQDTQGAYSDCN
jgi:hypothetical protein